MEKNFAARLNKAMQLRNISQAELVEKTGITKGAISQYLKGEYEPKKLNTAKLAKALDVNQAWLEGESDNMERHYRLQEGGGRFPEEAVDLMKTFNMLNSVGKNEAIKRIEELTCINKYEKNGIVKNGSQDFIINLALLMEYLADFFFILESTIKNNSLDINKLYMESSYALNQINNTFSGFNKFIIDKDELEERYNNSHQNIDLSINGNIENNLILNAAREIEGASEEDKHHDNDIMDDNNF